MTPISGSYKSLAKLNPPKGRTYDTQSLRERQVERAEQLELEIVEVVQLDREVVVPLLLHLAAALGWEAT